jgi:hypothetical protein
MSGDPMYSEECRRQMLNANFIQPIYQSTHRPNNIQVIYPYPPFLLMEDGTYFEMPDILTLVKMVYDLRKRVEELEAVHE